MNASGAIDISRFLPLFFEEAQEHLAVLERGLVAAEDAEDPRALVDDCFRAAHSLKGSAGSLGLNPVVDLTHVMESALDEVRGGSRVLDADLAGKLLVGLDLLTRITASLSAGGDGNVEGAAAWIANGTHAPPAKKRSKKAHASTDAAPEPPADPRRWTLEVHAEAFRCGLDPFVALRDLDMLGGITSGKLHLDRVPALQDLDPTSCHLTWDFELGETVPPQAVAGIFQFANHLFAVRPTPADPVAVPVTEPQVEVPVEAAPPATTPSPRAAANKSERATLRIATDKVDGLVDIVGELVISQAILGEMLGMLGPEGERVRGAFAVLERNTREVQERAMGIRMLPVAVAFERMPRLVRDLGARLGKQIRVQVEGEETELDRSVLEHLTDPLTHLVRNCADHGLETPDERLAAGKSPSGTVTIRAMHEGSSVVIEVSDDGRGLDRTKIRARAESRGLIAPGTPLSEEETIELLFTPGFSTAEAVSDVSGRGVGMDVVRHSIEALGGRVSLASPPGHGTVVKMAYPLTLAIVEGLCVRVGESTYVVPMAAVTGSLRPARADLRSVLGRGETIIAHGQQLPLVRLGETLNVPYALHDPTTALCVTVQHDGEAAALLVDHITGSAQAVIKNLERNFQRVEGVMGATILGDGRVALVLDIAGVLRLALGRGRGGRGRFPQTSGEAPCTAPL